MHTDSCPGRSSELLPACEFTLHNVRPSPMTAPKLRLSSNLLEISDELSPSRGPKLSEFWSAFGNHQARLMCEAPETSKRSPRIFSRALTSTLSLFYKNLEIRNSITAAVLPVLQSQPCANRWLKADVEKAVREAKRTGGPERSLAVLQFFESWLAAMPTAAADDKKAVP